MKKFLSLALSVLCFCRCWPGAAVVPPQTTAPSRTEAARRRRPVENWSCTPALNEDNTIAMAEQFEKDTGIEVEYISLGGGDAVARVQAEMSNPQADFLVGGSVDLYGSLAEAGALLEYDSPNNDDLDARFNDPNHLWQGWYMGVLSIIINEE